MLLTSLSAFSLSKLLGKNCGLDCDFSDFGFIENLLLLCVFVIAYLLGSKLYKYIKNTKP